MTPISLIVVARNEADCIEYTLAGLRDIVREMVLVDHGSSDNTKDVAQHACQQLGIDFVYKRIEDPPLHPEPSLELAVGLASQDWVLRLDADEMASSGLVSLLTSEELDAAGYCLQRMNVVTHCDEVVMRWVENHAWLVRLVNKNFLNPPNPLIHTTFEVNGAVRTCRRGIWHERSAERVYHNNLRYNEVWKSVNNGVGRTDHEFFSSSLEGMVTKGEDPRRVFCPWPEELHTW